MLPTASDVYDLMRPNRDEQLPQRRLRHGDGRQRRRSRGEITYNADLTNDSGKTLSVSLSQSYNTGAVQAAIVPQPIPGGYGATQAGAGGLVGFLRAARTCYSPESAIETVIQITGWSLGPSVAGSGHDPGKNTAMGCAPAVGGSKLNSNTNTSLLVAGSRMGPGNHSRWTGRTSPRFRCSGLQRRDRQKRGPGGGLSVAFPLGYRRRDAHPEKRGPARVADP